MSQVTAGHETETDSGVCESEVYERWLRYRLHHSQAWRFIANIADCTIANIADCITASMAVHSQHSRLQHNQHSRLHHSGS